jgi:hypothetical protein
MKQCSKDPSWHIGGRPYIGSISRHVTVGLFQPLSSRTVGMTLNVVHVHSWHVVYGKFMALNVATGHSRHLILRLGSRDG